MNNTHMPMWYEGHPLTYELVDLLLGYNKGLPGFLLLLGHLLSQRFLLRNLILQLLPQPVQLRLLPGRLFLDIAPFSLPLCNHLSQARNTWYE